MQQVLYAPEREKKKYCNTETNIATLITESNSYLVTLNMLNLNEKQEYFI